MTRHSDHADLIAQRREWVSRLRLRQMSQREIVKALAAMQPPMVNPATGKPWDVKQINRDLKHIRAEWHASTMQAEGEHRARQVAELAEVKREAVKQGDLRAWLAALKQEADLLGTAKPAGIHITDWRDDVVLLLREGKVTRAQVEADLGNDLAQEVFKRVGVVRVVAVDVPVEAAP